MAEELLSTIKKQQAALANQSKTAATPILQNASSGSTVTKVNQSVPIQLKTQPVGNPLTVPTQTAEDIAKQDRIDQTALVEQGMQDQNKIATDFGLKSGPSTIQEAVDQFKAKQGASKTALEQELSRQKALDDAAAAKFNEQAAGSIGADSAAYAQGREGAMSGSAAGLHNEFTSEVNKQISQNKIKLASAQAQRDSLMRQLEEAQQSGNDTLVESISKSLSQAKQTIEQTKTNYLNALSQASEQARLSEQNTRQNLTTYTGMVDSGATLSTQGIISMASTLNIPFEVANSYYESAANIRDDKKLSLEEKQIKLDDLKFGFNEKIQGIRGEQAQAVNDFSKLAKSGNYSQEQLATFATAMNIPNDMNPLYQSKVRLESAQATLEELNAKYKYSTPPIGTKDYLEYKKAELELQIAEADNAEYTGNVPETGLKDIFAIPGKSRVSPQFQEGHKQCGEAYNDLTEGTKVGNSYDSKMAIVAKDKDGNPKQSNPEVGNGLIIPLGGTINGHIETIIQSNPSTGDIKTVSYNRDGKGTQTIQSYNIKDLQSTYGDNWGFSDSKLKSEYATKLSDLSTQTTVQKNGGDSYNKFYQQGLNELDMKPSEAKKYAQDQAAKELNTAKEDSINAKEVAQTIMKGNTGLDIDALPQKQRAEVAKELSTLKEAALKNGDTLGYLSASAGGKQLGATEVQSLAKAQNVISQLSGLEEQINSMDTGPITGAFKSANPYDVDTAKLKAQLQAIVPNLARGVYGEVGVLTDADVKNYIATLPNGFSTDDQKKALLDFTKKTVAKSIEGNLKNYAMSGYNVSGYTPVLETLGVKRKISSEEQAAKVKGFLDFGKSLIESSHSETGQYSIPEDHSINNYEF